MPFDRLLVLSEKEREHAELDSEVTDANRVLQTAETTLSNLNAQAKAKREELKSTTSFSAHWRGY
jgi:hypothetical protein